MNELLPLVLLFVFGGFAVLSAGLKSRAGIRAPLGVALAVVEALSGLALMAASIPMSGSLQTGSRIAIFTAVIVALSSTVHLVKVRERNRARDESEGRRLYASVKYGLGGETAGGETASGERPDREMAGGETASGETVPDIEFEPDDDPEYDPHADSDFEADREAPGQDA